MRQFRLSARFGGVAFLALGCSIGCAHAATPGFNCAGATAPDEVTICRNERLAALDRQMTSLFFALRDTLDAAQQQTLRNDQRVFLRRRAACKANVACLAAAYHVRIEELRTRTLGTGRGGGGGEAGGGGDGGGGGGGGGGGAPPDNCDRHPTLC